MRSAAAAPSSPSRCWSTCWARTPAQATTGSLVVVGVTSLIGAVTAHRAGNVLLARGVTFGIVAIGGAAAGAQASAHVARSGAARRIRRADAARRRPDGDPAAPPRTSVSAILAPQRKSARSPRLATADARRPHHHLQPDLHVPVPPRAQGPGHRHRGRTAHRLPRRRRRLPRRARPRPRARASDDLRRRHLPGRHHLHQRRRPRGARRRRHHPRLDPGRHPHRRLQRSVASQVPGSPTASTPPSSQPRSPSWCSPSPSTPPPRRYPRSSEPPNHRTPSTSTRNGSRHDVDGHPPPRPQARHRPRALARLQDRPTGSARHLGHRPRQARHRSVAAAHHRPRRLRPAGRAQPLRRRLAGRRLRVRRRPRTGPGALRRQRQLRHPGRRPVLGRPRHRGRRREGPRRGDPDAPGRAPDR